MNRTAGGDERLEVRPKYDPTVSGVLTSLTGLSGRGGLGGEGTTEE